MGGVPPQPERVIRLIGTRYNLFKHILPRPHQSVNPRDLRKPSWLVKHVPHRREVPRRSAIRSRAEHHVGAEGVLAARDNLAPFMELPVREDDGAPRDRS